MEYVKKKPTFSEKYKLYGRKTQEFLGLRIRNSKGIVFT